MMRFYQPIYREASWNLTDGNMMAKIEPGDEFDGQGMGMSD